jgi:16S rRNA (guanine(1405)-N(7))-methyltransferase
MIPDELLQRLVNSILSSSRYQEMSIDLIKKISYQELSKGRPFKEAEKATRNKLHQIGGAFQEHTIRYPTWLEEFRKIPPEPGDENFKKFCLRMMGEHTSTRERIPIIGRFYASILDSIAPIESVVDLACGLNPLALPWMPLSKNAPYYGCDVYTDLANFLNIYLDTIRRPGHIEVCDLTQRIPAQPVHLALLLKTLPCLEQLNKSIGLGLLDGIQASYLLVTFPTASLGGNLKGMIKHYSNYFSGLIEDRSWTITRFEFPSELAFLVRK